MRIAKFYEALEVVMFIALDSGADPVPSKRICESRDVAPRHLEPILQALAQHQIIKGSKGPKGGYTLAREKRKITVGDIYRIFACHTLQNPATEIEKGAILPLSIELETIVAKNLDSKTVEELCQNFAKTRGNTMTSGSFAI